jgi:hypothetical protein
MQGGTSILKILCICRDTLYTKSASNSKGLLFYASCKQDYALSMHVLFSATLDYFKID